MLPHARRTRPGPRVRPTTHASTRTTWHRRCSLPGHDSRRRLLTAARAIDGTSAGAERSRYRFALATTLWRRGDARSAESDSSIFSPTIPMMWTPGACWAGPAKYRSCGKARRSSNDAGDRPDSRWAAQAKPPNDSRRLHRALKRRPLRKSCQNRKSHRHHDRAYPEWHQVKHNQRLAVLVAADVGFSSPGTPSDGVFLRASARADEADSRLAGGVRSARMDEHVTVLTGSVHAHAVCPTSFTPAEYAPPTELGKLS